MFIGLHSKFTEELVLIKIENILYIRDSFYYYPGNIESQRGAEVCLNGYDFVGDVNGHAHKTRIKFGVTETVEQILNLLNTASK